MDENTFASDLVKCSYNKILRRKMFSIDERLNEQINRAYMYLCGEVSVISVYPYSLKIYLRFWRLERKYCLR